MRQSGKLEQQVIMFSSAAQLCPTLRDPMDCSTPGFPVHDQLPELAQIHAHHISDAIQPSHPLSSPSPPAFIPASGSFQMSQFFASGAQSIGASASAPVLKCSVFKWCLIQKPQRSLTPDPGTKVEGGWVIDAVIPGPWICGPA